MTLTDIRNALDSLGVRPRQVLGQNFLHDQNLARWILSQAALDPDRLIVEIGPGLGALTSLLIGRCSRLVAIEKDIAMVRWLGSSLPSQGVELFHADALDFDLRCLWGWGPATVIGNLPYYVSTPLIAKFTSALSPASQLVLTLQLEVARRLGARTGDPDYGAMSVCVQRHWKVEFLKKLPPTVFYPEPKVASAVVRLTPRPDPEIPTLDEACFESLVRRGFQARRKQLKNLLPEFRDTWPTLARTLDLPVTARAENLSLPQWEYLAREASPGEAQQDAELFDVVDECDRVIRPMPRDHVHVNNLRHRAVHVLLYDQSGRLFLQRRTRWKDKSPRCWDSSTAGHVDAGETYAAAAERELHEELGVSCPLQRIGRIESSAATAWEFVEIFRGQHEGPFRLACKEVETGAFFEVAQIHEWMQRRPQDFTPLSKMIFPQHVFGSCVAATERYE